MLRFRRQPGVRRCMHRGGCEHPERSSNGAALLLVGGSVPELARPREEWASLGTPKKGGSDP
jgi:hypothetical protein